MVNDMKRFLASICLLALPLAAEQKVFVLKYADPRQIATLLQPFVKMQPNEDMHALAVEGDPSQVAVVEEALKRLDVPSAQPKNIELTVYFLAGSAAAANTAGGPVPKDLDSVVAQLKNNFPYPNYRLLDALTVRTRTGLTADASSAGTTVTIGTSSAPVINQFKIGSATIAPDGGVIRIDHLKAGERIPIPVNKDGQYTYVDIGYNADGLDIKEGQKAVIGRLGASGDQALFLVLVAHVLP
jgi:hypothetical protein